MTLISTIDGQASLINNKVTVNQTYEVPHNVDHSIGNIDFVGNVVVRQYFNRLFHKSRRECRSLWRS